MVPQNPATIPLPLYLSTVTQKQPFLTDVVLSEYFITAIRKVTETPVSKNKEETIKEDRYGLLTPTCTPTYVHVFNNISRKD